MFNIDEMSEELDYEKWIRMDLWNIQEGICLLLGVEPRSHMLAYRSHDEYRVPVFWRKFDEIAILAERSIISGNLKCCRIFPNFNFCELSPRIFLAWAKGKKIEFHESMMKILDDCSSLNTQIKNQDNNEIKEADILQVKEGTPRASKLSKMKCQAIAQTLWDIYPDMTIEDMKKQNAIQEYGEGKYYTGKNTLRDWLSEVDPRASELKTGRPKNK